MIDMYASDLTQRKRAKAIYRDLQLQKEWFKSGETIRILGQKGGNDYSYMMELEQGCVNDICWQFSTPIQMKRGNGPVTGSLDGLAPIDFTNVFDYGYGKLGPTNNILDDALIPIPMENMEFYFLGTSCGGTGTNSIWWNTNNVLAFNTFYGPSLISIPSSSSVSLNPSLPPTGPGILLGNYDRLCSNIFISPAANTEDNKYCIKKFVVYFGNYYTDTSGFDKGKYQIRLIRELVGEKRQWVEVSVISAIPSPGYSNNPAVNYPSGTQKDPTGNTINQDSAGNPIIATKQSPYNVTDGTNLFNPCGSLYSEVSPQAGTTFIFQSDSVGHNWIFSNNAYLDV